MTDQPAPTGAPEPPPSTEVLQTLQRRAWIRIIVGVVGAIVVLVGLGWVVGAVAAHFDVPAVERELAAVQDAPDAATLTSLPGTGAVGAAEATVHWSPSLAQAVLVAKGLPETGDDEEFAVWYVDGDAAAAVTRFTADGGAASVVLGPLWNAGETIQLTVEPRAGSSEQPSGEPVLTIETAAG